MQPIASFIKPAGLAVCRRFVLTAVLFVIAAELQAVEPVAQYGVGDWPVPGLGNMRARLSVSKPADAVWAHIPWRRRDAEPEKKDAILVDAATGKRVNNVLRVQVSRETGDFLFQPPTAPGEYFLYYLPFRTAGEWYFPSTIYLAPTNTADPAWAAAQAANADRIRQGQTSGMASAALIDLQAINDFHRFDPMEITATAEEMRVFLSRHGNRPYLVFPQDRLHPIRMTDEIPLCWVLDGPSNRFAGEARPGEFYSFQAGVYALGQPLEITQTTFTDLTAESGAKIPASALRCINVAGTNWLGKPIRKTVNVPKGKVQALWFGVAVPPQAQQGIYRGTVTIAAANAPATEVALQLTVAGPLLADAGDSDLPRQARLRWLDSSIGLDEEVFAPYTPVALQDQTVAVLGRKLRFNRVGLPESIVSTFSRNVDATNGSGRELLAAPVAFVVETAEGPRNWSGAAPRVVGQTTGGVTWEASSTSGPLTLVCRAKMECDGYVNYRLSLQATDAVDLKDTRLEIPLRRDLAVYMMGLGRKGGYRPESWHWSWNVEQANSQLWIGDVDAGLSCKLKHLEDRWDLFNMKETGTYRDWSNNGRGGCDVVEEGGDRVVIRAYSGGRSLKQGETLHFNFGLLITPVKTLDKAHWGWRYFHQGSSRPVPEIADTGARIINLHQGDPLNPYINYPFLTTERLSAYAKEAHDRQMKVKIYYTIRELSDYTAEFWALRSLGNEVFTDGPGFQLADQFNPNRKDQALPKTGDSWLCEHAVTGYVPAWHTPLGNGQIDAAIATSGLSRWHNYYLEGLNWLIRNVGIDGLYLDGIGYDREIMKRVRKVMQRGRPGCLIDFHSGNSFSPQYGLVNCANGYMELFPCIDSLWFGEGFNYNETPDYWMVEIAGIPYGLFGEMLEGGGNPWRGMLFGMTGRLGWGGDPRPIWKAWDDFKIQDATMSGFWDPKCPVKTGHKEVLATAYVQKGQTLISLASWATQPAKVRLQLDLAALGLDRTKVGLYAPSIRGFQPERLFKAGDEIPVNPGRGWLLLADEQEHTLAVPADLQSGRTVLFEEKFNSAQLGAEWKTALSKRPGTTLTATVNGLTITAQGNSAAFAERPCPPGTALAVCDLNPGTDKGASWGPGLSLVWTNGTTLRVNARAEGRFGVDDGRRQLLEGMRDEGKPCHLIIALDEKEVIVQAQQEDSSLQELARFPRKEFPGDPAAVRIGKMSPGSRNEDYFEASPEGVSVIRHLRLMSKAR